MLPLLLLPPPLPAGAADHCWSMPPRRLRGRPSAVVVVAADAVAVEAGADGRRAWLVWFVRPSVYRRVGYGPCAR